MKSMYRFSKRVALILLAVALIGVSLAGNGSRSAHAAPSNALLAVPDLEWTQLFARSSGWIGADGIFSIPLDGNDAIGSANGSTKTMFVFSDTLLGNVDGSTLQANLTGFVNHSSAVLTGNAPNGSSMNFVYGTGGDLTNTNLFGDSIWLNDGIAIGNTVYLTGFAHDSEWNATRLDLIGVPIVNGQPDYASYTRTQNIAPFYRDSNAIVMFGVGYLDNSTAAGAPNPDGYVYVYGYRNTLSSGVKDLVAARVPRGDFAGFSQWRYWNGSSWATNVSAVLNGSASLASEVSTELSVTPINSGVYNGKYMLVYTRNVGSNALEYRVADSPIGVFGNPVQFYSCEEPYIYAGATNASTHCYNAKAHPHLSQAGELLISYNVNQTNGFLPSTNQIYRPRFVKLNLNAFGTVSDPRGTQVNVALNKSVTANTNGSAASRAVDGKWKDLDQDKWVGLIRDSNGEQWLQVDLGQSYPISRWVVKHAGYALEPTVYNTRDFTLQMSANGTTWSNVDAVVGNTHNITDRAIPTANARYFRLLITTPTQSTDEVARIYEWELYQTTSSSPGNLALYRPTVASENMLQAQRVTDGSWSQVGFDKWVALDSGNKWIAVDLGDFYTVNRWVVRHAGAAGEAASYNTRDFKLQSSNDGLKWIDRDSVSGNTLSVTDRTVSGFTARYIRLYITDAGSDNVARIYEIEAYGASPGSALFSTGFESADPQPTWLDTLHYSQNVSGYFSGINPEASPRSETAHGGSAALMYSGKDDSATVSYANFKVFDVNIPITADTKLSYWIYPQMDNARYVGIDLIMTDGTTLRDSGAVDANGFGMHPNAGHGGNIPLNAWTRIQSNIGQWLAGKTIDLINVNYDRPASTGQFRGYLDDVVLTNGQLP